MVITRTMAAAAGLWLLASGAVVMAAPADSRGQALRPHRSDITRPIPRTTPLAGQQSQPLSLQDALPDNSAALRDNKSDIKAKAGPGLGRLPLQSGSIGIETETMVKPNQLPDGRPISSLEATARQDPSYLGLSLSLPTPGKTLIPLGPN